MTPPKPKFHKVWSLDQVFATFRIPSKYWDLTYSLVMLIAFVTGQRCQTLASLDVSGCHMKQFSNYLVLLQFGILSRIDQAEFLRTFVCFSILTRIYVRFLYLFAIYRSPKPYESRHSSYLLPISCKPHNKVSSSTIGRWLKEVLCRAGIDTSVYQAHSTRSASTSKASAVVPVDVIMTLAGWSQESTFRKHYDKSVAVTDQMSNAVLDQLNV